ncbi:alpha/beta fold hydrolase [Mucilaginibacter sabulilitoris]|uniref:Alpha/beta fold hydrolase n=1 Tax=Mucilaginibacter sabulilitoris TaxID=1173583 RepID=A0ABZ0TJF8_9SPHI|nr:alpha/beta fold hydrolase [Mucilaginibacter sabulilitoris]WPU93178.1 alpha/beta fold hydrolase [Mucilaginibacter sabulilitoris]
MKTPIVKYLKTKVDDLNVFYREAGPKDAPVVLLLHGYPTSSHMYRNLIPILGEKYHVIAPDLIGFGYSDAPHYKSFHYTFDNLTKYVQGFVDQLGLKRFAIQVFDYGAPVGYRLAVANPEKITGIISQNGNAYEEGLSDGWNPIQKYWADPSEENRNNLRSMSTAATTQWQYFTGVSDKSLVAPESYSLDQFFLDREENEESQLDLFKDYASNVAMYPAFHQYFRESQVPFLAVWGDKDPFFLPPGAEAFKRDLPNAIVKFFDTGHFALETHVNEIGEEILKFLETLPE